MDKTDIRARITTKYFKREFEYDKTIVLTASAQYPEVSLADRAAQDRINRRIRAQVERFERYISTALYIRAVREYKYSIENNIPVRVFEAVLQYETTYNENCHLSIYRDLYQYTGGAHGSTLRLSDTWDLRSGKTLPLGVFIDVPGNKKSFLIGRLRHKPKKTILQTRAYISKITRSSYGSISTQEATT
jgi:hypothetical protein